MSSKGYHWYNNGEIQINAIECPEGFTPGMLISATRSDSVKKAWIDGKIKQLTPEQKLAKAKKISQTKSKKFNELLDKISYDDLYDRFINQNKTYKELQIEYNISEFTLGKLLKYYNIFKPKSLSAVKGLETKYSEAGSKENYNKQMIEARTETIKQFGTTEYYKARSNKMIETKVAKYGTSGYRDTEKTKQTCLERYGVEYPCMRKEARSKSGNNSSANLLFEKVLNDNGIPFEREFVISNKSYDFKVNNILIEVNPCATHNSTWGIYDNKPKERTYHYNKAKLAVDSGYRCINIWDWDDLDKIISLLKRADSIVARKCVVKEISILEAAAFINNYHLQGYAKDSIRLGLYYNNQLVSVMTFGKPRYNKNYQYELVRYCSSLNIIGGAEKLFKHFLKTFKPESIISYCDNSKFSGNTYIKLGFKLSSKGQPSKHWYNPKTGQHITDNLLRQQGFDHLFGTNYGKGSSNEELMIANKFVEIYDCGQSRYIWNS